MQNKLGASFGVVLAGLGIIALAMGVWGIYSAESIAGSFLGGLLLLGGGATALVGARYASTPLRPSGIHGSPIGTVLFGLCFLVSIILFMLGLKDIFTNPLKGAYFLGVAFVGASISTWSVLSATRPRGALGSSALRASAEAAFYSRRDDYVRGRRGRMDI